MSFAISELTEPQLIAAEEEQGTLFVEPFRKFLLNNRFTVMDLDEESAQPLSIVPLSVVQDHYEYVSTIATGIVLAERI